MEKEKKSGGSKAVSALVVGALLCGGAWLGYQKYEGEHFLVKGAGEYLKSRAKAPSSFKIKKASFHLTDGQVFNGGRHDRVPTVTIDFEAKNAMGTPLAGLAVLYLGINVTGNPNYEPKLVEAMQRNLLDDNERIKKGLVVTPFERLAVQAAHIDGTDLTGIELTLLQAKIGQAKQGYSGPSIGGKVREYRPQTNDVDCSFDKIIVDYTPGKLLPYSK